MIAGRRSDGNAKRSPVRLGCPARNPSRGATRDERQGIMASKATASKAKRRTTPKARASAGAAARPSTATTIDVGRLAFDAFTRELDALTIPDGEGRRVATIQGAALLSRTAARVSGLLGGAVLAGIGDGAPVDRELLGVLEAAAGVLVLPGERQRRGDYQRFQLGDVLTREQVESFHAACRMLALRAKAETGAAAGPEDKPQPRDRLQWLAKAMLKVTDEPHLSNAKIAESVGVHPSTLSRSRLYQRAAKQVRRQAIGGTFRGDIDDGPDTSRAYSRQTTNDAALDAQIDREMAQRNATRNASARKPL